jgi:hypothetical protein
MTDEQKIVADIIRDAFAGVNLGSGVGLMQGQGLDDYADDATLAELRSQDESSDWSRIDLDQLNAYSASLAFMDSAGMRFHLPAYLIADLQSGLIATDILFYLAGTSDFSCFHLLDGLQRESIKKFLRIRLSDPGFRFQHSMIEAALKNYWDRD